MGKQYADRTLSGTNGIGSGTESFGSGSGSLYCRGRGDGQVIVGGQSCGDYSGIGWGIHDDIRELRLMIIDGFHGYGRGTSNGYGVDYGGEIGFDSTPAYWLIEDLNNRR